MRVKQDAVSRINKWLNKFSNIVQDNCYYYAFYRAMVYSNEDGIINIKFLCSNEEGLMRAPTLQYNSEANTLVYDYAGEKFNFKDEDAIKKAICELIQHLSAFKQPINRILFDTCIYNASISDVFIRNDTKHEGEVILYCVSKGHTDVNYNINEEAESYGLEFCSDWSAEAKVDFVNFIEAGY